MPMAPITPESVYQALTPREFHTKYGLRMAINVLLKHNLTFFVSTRDKTIWCFPRGHELIRDAL